MLPLTKRQQSKLRGLGQALKPVPEDRLTWRPCPTATTALGIAAHIIRGNYRYCAMSLGENLPPRPPEEIPDRQQLLERLRESEGHVRTVFEQLSPEALR